MATHYLYGAQTIGLEQPNANLDATNTELSGFVMRQFPYGAYFDRSSGWLPRVTRGIARFLSRLVKRREAFEKQIDPRTADELLDEWESAYGLEIDEALNINTRREQVLVKVRSTGGIVAEYYQALAVDFGYADAVVTDAADPFTTTSLCDDVLGGGEWKVTFTVTATSQGATRDALLEELINSQLLAGWYAYYEFS